MQAYSTPTTPAPMTMIERGREGMERKLSESTTAAPSNGTDAGRAGVEPEATRMESARTSSVSAHPSRPSRRLSRKNASPRSTSTPLRRSCRSKTPLSSSTTW